MSTLLNISEEEHYSCRIMAIIYEAIDKERIRMFGAYIDRVKDKNNEMSCVTASDMQAMYDKYENRVTYNEFFAEILPVIEFNREHGGDYNSLYNLLSGYTVRIFDVDSAIDFENPTKTEDGIYAYIASPRFSRKISGMGLCPDDFKKHVPDHAIMNLNRRYSIFEILFICRGEGATYDDQYI